MDKYKPVQEILQKDGIALDELLQLVKSGKLALYAMKRQFEYEVITSFDRYVDDYIEQERVKAKETYYHNVERNDLPNERKYRILGDSSHFRENEISRNIGFLQMLADKRDSKLKWLADRDGIARWLAKDLFVKTSDYENMANSGNSPRQGKRQDTEARMQETLEACKFVEMKHGPILLNKSKDYVLSLVKAEMNDREPYRQTFNDWYTACPFTRRAGNPNNRKKPA